MSFYNPLGKSLSLFELIFNTLRFTRFDIYSGMTPNSQPPRSKASKLTNFKIEEGIEPNLLNFKLRSLKVCNFYIYTGILLMKQAFMDIFLRGSSQNYRGKQPFSLKS